MTDPSTLRWYDDEAGPLVRLYAMTAGRARPGSEVFDLMATVQAVEPDEPAPMFSPEPNAILQLCVQRPRPVADIASDAGLPLGVVRVLLSDLLTAGLIQVGRPVPPARLPDARLLKELIDGLRAL